MMLLLGACPLVAWGLWTCVFMAWKGRGVREALMVATPLMGVWLVVGTEVLGIFHAIERGWLVAWWGMAMVAGAVMWRKHNRNQSGVQNGAVGTSNRLDVCDAVMGGLIVVLVAACGVQAVVSPPTNVDSLTYHLPRQVMWAQQHNVADFSTNNVRQIMMPPYTEFVGLHLLVLTGGDALHNLVQWSALVVMLVAVSLVAKEMGATRSGQLLAALFAVSIPCAFLEASNTKNDVVLAMWVTIALYWMMVLRRERSGVLPRSVVLGLCIGAGVLTKGTGVFFMAPVGLTAAVMLFYQERLRAILPVLVMGAAALSLNAGYFARNVQQFGKIAGPASRAEGGYDLVNALKTPAAVASNVLRNLAVEAPTPWRPVNDTLERVIVAVHVWMGIDPQDTRTTFRHSPYPGVVYHPHEEDLVGSPAQVLVAMLSLPLLLMRGRVGGRGRVTLIYGVAGAGFLLFCVMLRWQAWNARFLIPPLCVLAPAVGALWTHGRWRFAAPAVGALCVVTLVPTLLLNDRPLMGAGSIFRTSRAARRFTEMPGERVFFQRMLAAFPQSTGKDGPVVAFATGGNSPEYLAMRLLLDRFGGCVRFEYVAPTTVLPGSAYWPPDVVIGKPEDDRLVDPSSHRTFVAVQQNPYFSFLVPGDAAKVPRVRAEVAQ